MYVEDLKHALDCLGTKLVQIYGQRPRTYCFVDGLPKNNYGKVLKAELRKCLQDESRNEMN